MKVWNGNSVKNRIIAAGKNRNIKLIPIIATAEISGNLYFKILGIMRKLRGFLF